MQSKQTAIKYIWIDTCCIDKSDAREFQEAVSSMFRWYKGARVCYAYLSDVSKEEGGPLGYQNCEVKDKVVTRPRIGSFESSE